MENPAEYEYRDFKWREELIDGVIVAMAPGPSVGHSRISQNISRMFGNYLRGKKCEAFIDGVDLHLTEKDCFQPDCMIVCDPDKVRGDGVHGAADLVVEVLSPSTAGRDRGYKRQVYEQCGVRKYWLVSPGDRSIEIYLLKEGKFELENVYALYRDFELNKLTPAQRAAIPMSFKCSLFDDLDIHIEDVFERVE